MEQRTAILLRELEGLTSTEIAEVSGVPAATVRSRIFYGLKSLRAMLPEYGLTSQHRATGGTTK
jgi:RNA polymerase sigma-70 factor (ECF subfamily)